MACIRTSDPDSRPIIITKQQRFLSSHLTLCAFNNNYDNKTTTTHLNHYTQPDCSDIYLLTLLCVKCFAVEIQRQKTLSLLQATQCLVMATQSVKCSKPRFPWCWEGGVMFYSAGPGEKTGELGKVSQGRKHLN
jgi:hypothetical protein